MTRTISTLLALLIIWASVINPALANFWGPGSFGGGFWKPPSVSDSIEPLDMPIYSATSSAAQDAFAFDCVVDGYAGDTVRLKKTTGGDEQDFGCTASRRFNTAAVDTWRAGGDVDLVKYYSQKGTGKELLAMSGGSASTVPVTSSGSWVRLGTTMNASTAALTRSATDGAVTANVTGGKYLELASSGLSADNGMEVFFLGSSNKRKIASTDTSDPTALGGDTAIEAYYSYGVGLTNYVSFELGAGPSGNYTYQLARISTSNQLEQASGDMKQNSLALISTQVDANLNVYRRGKLIKTDTTNGTNVTANGLLDDGTLRVGRKYSGAANEATDTGDFRFSGIIITETLTAAQRGAVTARLNQVAMQHRAASLATLMGTADEILYWPHANLTSGKLYGLKGQLSLTINTATSIGGNTPSWNAAQADPAFGWTGLRSNGTTNLSNGFVADTNYFMDQHTGGILNIDSREEGGDLAFIIASGNNTTIAGLKATSGTNSGWSIGQGYHHAQPTFYGKVYQTLDPTGKTNQGVGGGWGDRVLSQASWKYMFPLAHGDLDTRETVDITGVTQANPVVVTAPSHGRSTGNIVYIESVAGTTEINDDFYTITKIDNDSFSLDSTDGTSWTAYTSGGTVKLALNAEITGETQAWPVGTPIDWAHALTDLGIYPSTPEGRNYKRWTQKFPSDADQILLQVANFDVGETYDPDSPVVADMRTGSAYSYAIPMGTGSVGNIDMGYASKDGWAPVVHSDPNGRLQTMPYLSQYDGRRMLSAFKKGGNWTVEEIEQWSVNWYKFWDQITVPTPSNTVAPTVTGSAQDGQTLSGAVGTWSSGLLTPWYTYQWQYLDGTWQNISGATSINYTLVSADVGYPVRLAVTATLYDGSTSYAATAYSSATLTVTAGPPVNTVAPAASGTVRVAETVSSDTGTWIGTPTITYAHQWQHSADGSTGWANISGATSSSYAIDAAYAAEYLRDAVAATNGVGTVTAYSNVLGPVAAALSIPAPTTDWGFNDGSGTTVADAKSVVNATFAGAPTWGSGYASQTGGVSTGYADASANANHYTNQKWTAASWVTLNSSPVAQNDLMAIGTNASTLAANRAMYTYLNVGATSLTFNITDSSSADHSCTVSGIALDTTNKALVVLDYDPTGGNGATVMHAYVYEEGSGLVGSCTKTDANPMRQNSAFKLADRRNSGGGGQNIKTYRLPFWAGSILTTDERADLYTAGSESTAY